MSSDSPKLRIHCGRFQLDLTVYHVTASQGGDGIQVWLGPPDAGPLVAVINGLDAEQPIVEVSQLWRGHSKGWKTRLVCKAVETCAAGRERQFSGVAVSPLRVCEG